MSEVKQIQKPNRTPIFAAVIVLLVGLLGIMTYMWSKKIGEIKVLTEENKHLSENLEAMYEAMPPSERGAAADNMIAEFKQMMDNYDLLQKEGRPEDQAAYAEQKEKIATQLAEIEKMKRQGRYNAGEMMRMQKEIGTLREIMKGYIRQIDELNTKNTQLTADLDKTSTELSETQTERNDYKNQATESQEKVKKGQRLQALSLNTTGLRMKLNDQLEATAKARNCVQASAAFTIGENSIADAGSRTLYMQIIDPDGKPLQGRSGGTTSTENGTVVYGAKREINYGNKAVDVTIFFDFNGEEPVAGSYKVKIYCGSDLIGSDSFSLK
jgi:DNA repair ATPase RecN